MPGQPNTAQPFVFEGDLGVNIAMPLPALPVGSPEPTPLSTAKVLCQTADGAYQLWMTQADNHDNFPSTDTRYKISISGGAFIAVRKPDNTYVYTQSHLFEPAPTGLETMNNIILLPNPFPSPYINS